MCAGHASEWRQEPIPCHGDWVVTILRCASAPLSHQVPSVASPKVLGSESGRQSSAAPVVSGTELSAEGGYPSLEILKGVPLLERVSASEGGAEGPSRRRPRLVGPNRRESTVLVVGGAGYIGSILSAILLEDGYNVIVLDPLLYGGRSIASLVGRPRFELRVADTRDEAIVQQVLSRRRCRYSLR